MIGKGVGSRSQISERFVPSVSHRSSPRYLRKQEVGGNRVFLKRKRLDLAKHKKKQVAVQNCAQDGRCGFRAPPRQARLESSVSARSAQEQRRWRYLAGRLKRKAFTVASIRARQSQLRQGLVLDEDEAGWPGINSQPVYATHDKE